jgi:7,8-dihydropterin-6-yl-methyl-4-(beta-D-ribofuranosyl)aminobenzene 5'-phosphate synthase
MRRMDGRIPSRLLLRVLPALLGTGALWGCATQPAGQGAPAPASAAPRITILYDAFGSNAAFTKDWGFAALVEVGGKRILFDTGDNPEVFAHNVRAAQVDLKRLDFVVISHRHGDHMGGLSHLLSVNPRVRIYAPKEGFGVFGSSLPSSFYRRSDALPTQMRYFDGQPPAVLTFGTAWPGANIELIDKTTEIAPGITLIALISDAAGTRELKELSLAIDTRDGIVLVVGCSHPGIEAIVAEAARINPHILLIAGGFHLVVAADPAIEHVVGALRDTWHVEWVAPGHCTGEPTFAALQQAFGSHYLYAGLGTVLIAGATPSAAGGNGPVPASPEIDWNTYRVLAAAADP